ncbi:MCE-family protein MCE3A [Mycobacterium sp. E1747]|nr:MCE-family protein MCE3A [Mycobacterium sp. E1747]
MLLVCLGFFAGTFRSYIPVTLVSDRSGLVMESGAKVKLRGVDVGRVSGIVGGKQPVSLKLEIDPDQVRYIPANVQAEIKATTAFGAKYVDLIYPENPSGKRIAAGAVLRSRNVATEVNTVFDNLVGLLNQIDIAKLNSVLTALADGVRGKGARMGEALTDSDQVLQAINPRMDTVAANWRSFKGFNDAYGPAAKDILRALDAATTTSATINDHAKDLDTLLLSTTGFSNQGIELLGPNRDNLITGINSLEPTTSLLLKYNPELTCTIVGGRYFLDHGGREQIGGNGRTLVADAGLLFGDDLYSYPENLPIVAAKGGYNGEPSCGPLPDVKNNLPVRYLVTNTGWGTGLDMRPNPGLGHPCWVDFFPVTRGYSQPASLRQCLPGPAPGPAVPLGMPPYGAPWYGPDGAPLYPGVPPPPPPGPPSP